MFLTLIINVGNVYVQEINVQKRFHSNASGIQNLDDVSEEDTFFDYNFPTKLYADTI